MPDWTTNRDESIREMVNKDRAMDLDRELQGMFTDLNQTESKLDPGIKDGPIDPWTYIHANQKD